MTFTVKAHRNGQHIAHLDARFDNEAAARVDALAKNCKAFTPFFYTVALPQLEQTK
jgi:hypothetical protein